MGNWQGHTAFFRTHYSQQTDQDNFMISNFLRLSAKNSARLALDSYYAIILSNVPQWPLRKHEVTTLISLTSMAGNPDGGSTSAGRIRRIGAMPARSSSLPCPGT